MKNVEQPPPAVLFRSRRGRLLYIAKGIFTVKVHAPILAPWRLGVNLSQRRQDAKFATGRVVRAKKWCVKRSLQG
jgi:hypothetical protein